MALGLSIPCPTKDLMFGNCACSSGVITEASLILKASKTPSAFGKFIIRLEALWISSLFGTSVKAALNPSKSKVKIVAIFGKVFGNTISCLSILFELASLQKRRFVLRKTHDRKQH